jgi:hypothetical protein
VVGVTVVFKKSQNQLKCFKISIFTIFIGIEHFDPSIPATVRLFVGGVRI